MRKLTICCLVLVLCMQVFSSTIAFADVKVGDRIQIINYGDIGSNIIEGKDFELTLKCRNISADTVGNIYVDIDSTSDFYGSPTDNNISVLPGTLTNDKDGESLDALNLVYKGTGNYLSITFKYKFGGDDYTEKHKIYIKEAFPSSTPPTQSTPVDTSKYQPNPRVENIGEIPVLTAGVAKAVTYTIKNNSAYQAKNVVVSLEMV